ncbi:MAG: galactose mutarotase [Verrucomicrobia bacterium]|nr:MAG: galactose mutarotase [Verrucomicrobiota bacterium]
MTAHTVTAAPFGNLPDGRHVQIFTLTNKNGLRARICDYGALLVTMETPDRHGVLADLTHGFDTLAGWLANGPYFGASIGRFGNRLKDGKFALDGKDYTLATNNAPGGIPCHLHGGKVGFDKVLWAATVKGGQAVEMVYLSVDGEEGYPGNLRVVVTYTLTDEDELIWEAEATTDAPTPVNLVHHTYWNLSGDPSTPILDHQLMLAAAHYLPINPGLIPTGEIAPVAGTPMDFTTPHAIGERIDAAFEALELGAGYDHCWVLADGDGLRLAARVADPKSGRVMEILTDQPAIQFYAANFLDGLTLGKGGVAYARRSALCLETEGFPDAPNQPAFPSAVLRPGQTYHHTLIHRFTLAEPGGK